MRADDSAAGAVPLEVAVAKAIEAANAGRYGDCRALDRAVRQHAPGESRALFAALHCALLQDLIDEASALLDEAAGLVEIHAPAQQAMLWHYAQLAAQAFSPEPTPVALPPLVGAPLVSVVIPTVGGRDGLLNDALHSVRSQTYGNWEAIVVNARDCELLWESGDSTRERLIEPRRSLNAAQARNIGIDAASGRLIAFLDDDDLWRPDFLRQAVEVLRPGRFAGVFGNSEIVEEELTEKTRQVVRRQPAPLEREFSPGLLQLRNYIPNNELVFRREAVGSVRFAESMQIWEDWDFLLGVAKCGTFGRLRTVTGEYRRRISGRGHVSGTPADLRRHFDFIYARHSSGNAVIEAARRIYRRVQGFGSAHPA
jgi:hypothetical protein